jgi:hypothetical protein
LRLGFELPLYPFHERRYASLRCTESRNWPITKREPVSDVDTVMVDGLKALDPHRPIREADIGFWSRLCETVRFRVAGIISARCGFAVVFAPQ